MVHALIELDDTTNKVLTLVKTAHGLKDKGEAIRYVVQRYTELEEDMPIKASYVAKIKKLEKQKGRRFKSVSELRKYIEHA